MQKRSRPSMEYLHCLLAGDSLKFTTVRLRLHWNLNIRPKIACRKLISVKLKSAKYTFLFASMKWCIVKRFDCGYQHQTLRAAKSKATPYKIGDASYIGYQFFSVGRRNGTGRGGGGGVRKNWGVSRFGDPNLQIKLIRFFRIDVSQ